MNRGKYSNILTIILIISILIVLLVVGILAANVYKNYFSSKNDQKIAMQEFIKNSNEDIIDNNTENNVIDDKYLYIESNTDVNLTVPDTSTTGQRKVTYYPDTNFVVSGIIEIKAINLKYSILEKETAKSLEKSVAIRYPSNAQLNTAGNVVIVGHNYRDGRFFANLKKLAIDDEIKITDSSNKSLTYVIYDIFETTPEDTNYMTRNTAEQIEISLSTCTDDGKARLIILARAK